MCPLGASAASPIVYCLLSRLVKALQESQKGTKVEIAGNSKPELSTSTSCSGGKGEVRRRHPHLAFLGVPTPSNAGLLQACLIGGEEESKALSAGVTALQWLPRGGGTEKKEREKLAAMRLCWLTLKLADPSVLLYQNSQLVAGLL